MKKLTLRTSWLLALLSVCTAPNIYSGTQPKFTLIPTTPTTLTLDANSTATVGYQVTNKTKLTRTLTMVPIQGVTQITGSGLCANPFTLTPNSTCTLMVLVNGSQLPANGVSSGPEICKTLDGTTNTPDPTLCSQPSQVNSLRVSSAQGGNHSAFITDRFNSRLVSCTISSSGTLSNCVPTPNPTPAPSYGITHHPSLGIIYYVSDTSVITTCNVDSNSNLSNCTTANPNGAISNPFGIAINSMGTMAYVTNYGGGGTTVAMCSINPTGVITSCTLSPGIFISPAGVAVSPSGAIVYITEFNSNNVFKCNSDLSVCTNMNPGNTMGLSNPNVVVLNGSANKAYISNFNSGITTCSIDATGTFNSCSSFTDPAIVANPIGISLNALGTIAYIADFNNPYNIATCNINAQGNLVSPCTSISLGSQAGGITIY